MAKGFILDNSYGTRIAAVWYEGEVETSIWTGVKIKGRASHGLVSYRCVRCGFLENYAPD